MIWTISSFDSAKSLEEPGATWIKEIWYASSEFFWKDVKWMDIGPNRQSQ